MIKIKKPSPKSEINTEQKKSSDSQFDSSFSEEERLVYKDISELLDDVYNPTKYDVVNEGKILEFKYNVEVKKKILVTVPDPNFTHPKCYEYFLEKLETNSNFKNSITSEYITNTLIQMFGDDLSIRTDVEKTNGEYDSFDNNILEYIESVFRYVNGELKLVDNNEIDEIVEKYMSFFGNYIDTGNLLVTDEKEIIEKEERTIKYRIWPCVSENWTIYDIAINAPPPGWIPMFQKSLPELKNISEYVEKRIENNEAVFPLKRDIFRAFELTPLNEVKVVIFGQDPYPQMNPKNGLPRAQGLSFSVSRDDGIPVSLRVIYDEIQDNYPNEFIRPYHGDLTSWALQGVLMLNACLTVKSGQPKSHKSIWDCFIERVCTAISEVNPTCIFVMWGKPAQSLQKYLGSKSKKLIAGQPSSMNRNRNFRGCKHFIEINKLLREQRKPEINWNLN